MAVEATHHPLFHPQMMITNAAIDNQNQTTAGIANFNSYGVTNPLSTTAMYRSGYADSVNAFTANNAPLKAESGLTCSLPISRKRSRDSSDYNTLISLVDSQSQNQLKQSRNYTFLGEDISLQIQQQQLEIDQYIAHHTEKLKMEIEERRRQNSRRIIAAIEEQISKRLRAKEEEIVKIAKLNWALEEKVKSLCVENQIWRELAESNEATANALRNNLKQVLEQVVHEDYRQTVACVDEFAEDAQLCCESNNEEKKVIENDNCTSSSNNNNRLCKKCGREESRVLLLPCRHLCLCTGCASSVNICPVCKSTKNISVHVNLS
ncbi:probable BOI-related E3 ubiquitin-protein ligase 3 [Rutidosis leptorrhynchoides]|uniref:probable BOI-related E3 ubiquitin-protein ligase 3 n=1 Tax=Rutidosis leptorrhynchoides TaxID=125765 RepID=UPI003A995C8C